MPDDDSQTIDEFCASERISPSTYYKMKQRGVGPVEIHIPGSDVIRITAKARREWHEQLIRQAKTKQSKLERQRRVELGRRAGRRAADSPKHVSKRRRGA